MCPILQSGGLHIIFNNNNNNKMASSSLQVSPPWLCRMIRCDETIGRDATEMREAFITSLGFNSDRVKLSMSSNPSDVCALHQSFSQCAKKVE